MTFQLPVVGLDDYSVIRDIDSGLLQFRGFNFRYTFYYHFYAVYSVNSFCRHFQFFVTSPLYAVKAQP